MAWTLEDWKKNKIALEEAIKNRRNNEAKKLVDGMAREFRENKELAEKQFYTEFQDKGGTFNDYPLMSSLYYGNKEIFDYMRQKLNPDLSRAIGGNHLLINVGVKPCGVSEVTIDEARLREAQDILNSLNLEMSWEQKKKSNLLLLSVFFLNQSVVESLINDSRSPEVANEIGGRGSKPINIALSFYGDDQRYTTISDLLLGQEVVRNDLAGNTNFIRNALNNHNVALVEKYIHILNDNVVMGAGILLINALAVASNEANKEKEVGILRKLAAISISKLSNAPYNTVFNFIYGMQQKSEQLSLEHKAFLTKEFVKAIKLQLESGAYTLSQLRHEGCEELCNIIAKNPEIINGVVLGLADRELFYGQNGMIGSPVKGALSFESLDKVEFIPQELRGRLGNLIDRLAAVEKPDVSKLNNEYYKALKELFKLNQITVQNMDDFRLSVERHLSDQGRVGRLKLAHDVHEQVMFEMKIVDKGEVLPYEKLDLKRVLARTWNVIGVVAGALTAVAHNLVAYGTRPPSEKPIIIDEISRLPRKERDGKGQEQEKSK
jgi:hypothetical protein